MERSDRPPPGPPIGRAWWLTTFPGLAILLTVLSINLLGDWNTRRVGTSGGRRRGAQVG